MEAVVLAISHFHGVSHDPLPSTPAREKSAAVSMATGSAAHRGRVVPEVVRRPAVIFKHFRRQRRRFETEPGRDFRRRTFRN
ncbi:hypothetical protein PBY51_001147 [Eleginops maclovinus]|uniref:Uncharacterized protein n=1 Tax=Eleginops maclovinus TaxID=56733 RepID=A0AAN7XN90_ELEMC|nr:hypothetical protein PBY51_001147 [Eleginops maclovinus]